MFHCFGCFFFGALRNFLSQARAAMLDGSNQCEQIDQLAHQLKQVEARRCFGSAELELWTNLATFITPTRLSMSS